MLLTGCDDMQAHLYDAEGGNLIEAFSGRHISQAGHISLLMPKKIFDSPSFIRSDP